LVEGRLNLSVWIGVWWFLMPLVVDRGFDDPSTWRTDAVVRLSSNYRPNGVVDQVWGLVPVSAGDLGAAASRLPSRRSSSSSRLRARSFSAGVRSVSLVAGMPGCHGGVHEPGMRRGGCASRSRP